MKQALDKQPTVTVLGCGYVGVTTAVVLANSGFKVYAIEPNAKRLRILQQGRSFFYEAGVDALIASARSSGSIVFTDSYEAAVPNSTVVFSCVGTPDNADGSSNLTYVFEAAEQACKFMKPETVFVQKSTVPVGTGARVEELFAKAGASIHYVSNPEFLSESTAIKDTLWFDRIVAGGEDASAVQTVLDLYKTVEQNRDKIAHKAGVEPPAQVTTTQYIATARNSAELIKVSSNAFLALKISFANSVAKLADSAGADVTEVMAAVGADRRIGPAFFQVGRGYGGGCFPKDVSGLIRSAEDYGVDMEIMNAVSAVNSSMPHYIMTRAKAALGGTLKDKKVAVFGLSFKPGTSDTRRSPAIAIANTLAEQEADIVAYDPEAMEEAKPMLHERVKLCKDTESALSEADCVFIATDWPEFKSLTAKQLAHVSLLVDCMNCFDKTDLPKTVQYLGVGKR